jgi:hypothetical protein
MKKPDPFQEVLALVSSQEFSETVELKLSAYIKRMAASIGRYWPSRCPLLYGAHMELQHKRKAQIGADERGTVFVQSDGIVGAHVHGRACADVFTKTLTPAGFVEWYANVTQPETELEAWMRGFCVRIRQNYVTQAELCQ